MPLLLVLIGAVLIVTAIRGTTASLATHLGADLTSGFVKWLAALVLIGGIGYVPALRTPARYLLALVIVVILLKDGTGLLQSFVTQLESAPTPTPAQPAGGNAQLPAIPIDVNILGGSGGSGSGTGGSGLLGDLGSLGDLLPDLGGGSIPAAGAGSIAPVGFDTASAAGGSAGLSSLLDIAGMAAFA